MGCYRRGIRLSICNVERFESESIKGFGSHQEKCLSSSVIVFSKVKTAVNSNDAWNQSLWIPPVSRKKTQAHERQECKITANASLTSNRKEKNLTNQHIKYIPYLTSGSSLSAHWLQGESVLNWRLIAVPSSFLSITINFSCGLHISESNVIALSDYIVHPTIQTAPGSLNDQRNAQWWRALNLALQGHESDETQKHVQYCKWLGQSS